MMRICSIRMKFLKASHVISILLLLAGATSCIERRDSSHIGDNATADSVTLSRPDSLLIELTGIDSVSVFELLMQEHDVVFHGSVMGVFVKTIDSIENSDKYIWLFTVNDSLVSVSCDKYLTADGDTIRWHYRRLNH